ncbi:MAG: hypothetical protein ABSB33_08880 [Tepidisphaeraceae bacterium]|jgi:hypothetical protein
MRKRTGKKDVNEMALAMVEAIAAGELPASMKTLDGKNPMAVALGRRGGLKGGPARAAKLTARELSESAQKAARARWGRTNKADSP